MRARIEYETELELELELQVSSLPMVEIIFLVATACLVARELLRSCSTIYITSNKLSLD